MRRRFRAAAVPVYDTSAASGVERRASAGGRYLCQRGRAVTSADV